MSFKKALEIISKLESKQLISNMYFRPGGACCAIGALGNAQLTFDEREDLYEKMDGADFLGRHPAVNENWYDIYNEPNLAYDLFKLSGLGLSEQEAEALQTKNDLASTPDFHHIKGRLLKDSIEDQKLRYKIVLEWLEQQVKKEQ